MVILGWAIFGAFLYGLGIAFFIGSMVGQDEIFWRPKPTRLDYILCLIWPLTMVIAMMGDPRKMIRRDS